MCIHRRSNNKRNTNQVNANNLPIVGSECVCSTIGSAHCNASLMKRKRHQLCPMAIWPVQLSMLRPSNNIDLRMRVYRAVRDNNRPKMHAICMFAANGSDSQLKEQMHYELYHDLSATIRSLSNVSLDASKQNMKNMRNAIEIACRCPDTDITESAAVSYYKFAYAKNARAASTITVSRSHSAHMRI